MIKAISKMISSASPPCQQVSDFTKSLSSRRLDVPADQLGFLLIDLTDPSQGVKSKLLYTPSKPVEDFERLGQAIIEDSRHNHGEHVPLNNQLAQACLDLLKLSQDADPAVPDVLFATSALSMKVASAFNDYRVYRKEGLSCLLIVVVGESKVCVRLMAASPTGKAN